MTVALGLVALHAACFAILLLLAMRAPVARQDGEAGFVVIRPSRPSV